VDPGTLRGRLHSGAHQRDFHFYQNPSPHRWDASYPIDPYSGHRRTSNRRHASATIRGRMALGHAAIHHILTIQVETQITQATFTFKAAAALLEVREEGCRGCGRCEVEAKRRPDALAPGENPERPGGFGELR